jgi:hypothetical protein
MKSSKCKFKVGRLYKNRWGEVYKAHNCSRERICPLHSMTSCRGIVLLQVNSKDCAREMFCSSMSGAKMLTTELSKIEAMLYAL